MLTHRLLLTAAGLLVTTGLTQVLQQLSEPPIADNTCVANYLCVLLRAEYTVWIINKIHIMAVVDVTCCAILFETSR